jgi:hypothetical protein
MAEKMDEKFHAIMERMCRLGQLIPDIDDIDTDDDEQMAEVRIVIAEFQKTHAELYACMKEMREEAANEATAKRTAAARTQRRGYGCKKPGV